MKSNTQNNKLTSLTDKTLIIGIDVGSDKHYARAFDNRFTEYTNPKKPFVFNNDEKGFRDFLVWTDEMAHSHGKDVITVGMEPTGHYWINLGTLHPRSRDDPGPCKPSSCP